MAVNEAAKKLQRIQRGVKVITETLLTPDLWKTLVQTHAVKCVQVHDARTAALMLTHSIKDLLTLNKSDFARYAVDGINAITPAELVVSHR